jgi:hypothetical protein
MNFQRPLSRGRSFRREEFVFQTANRVRDPHAIVTQQRPDEGKHGEENPSQQQTFEKTEDFVFHANFVSFASNSQKSRLSTTCQNPKFARPNFAFYQLDRQKKSTQKLPPPALAG